MTDGFREWKKGEPIPFHAEEPRPLVCPFLNGACIKERCKMWGVIDSEITDCYLMVFAMVCVDQSVSDKKVLDKASET